MKKTFIVAGFAANGRIIAGPEAFGRIAARFAAISRIDAGFVAIGRINRSYLQFSKQRSSRSEFRSRFIFKAGVAVGVNWLGPKRRLVKEQGDNRLAGGHGGG